MEGDMKSTHAGRAYRAHLHREDNLVGSISDQLAAARAEERRAAVERILFVRFGRGQNLSAVPAIPVPPVQNRRKN
jgi:hypothetical protein